MSRKAASILLIVFRSISVSYSNAIGSSTRRLSASLLSKTQISNVWLVVAEFFEIQF